jgi:AcrR family transcriptional regulator
MPAERRREQLLDVARIAFARSGYRGTTALEIGREAGVSEKLVLKHFGSKEGIFRAAVVEPLLARFQAENDEARRLLDAGTPEDPDAAFRRVHAFLATWARHVREQGPLLLSFLAELRDFPDVAERLLGVVETQIDQAVETLTRGLAHTDCRPFDARVAIQASLGAATVAGLTAADPDAFIEEYLLLTLLGIVRR